MQAGYRRTLPQPETGPVALDDLALEAVARVECPKRTGFAPTLFPDVREKDTCTDGVCYQRKVNALVQRKGLELRERQIDAVQLHGEHWPVQLNDRKRKYDGTDDSPLARRF